jgi:hypothetical protein
LGPLQEFTSSVREVKLEFINLPLLKHPMNWVIVLLMVMIFGIAAHLVLDFYNLNPGKSS